MLRLIQRGHLATLERECCGPHSRISEVQHSKTPILHFGHGFDADEPFTELRCERCQRLKLGACVSEVVAMRVDDRRRQCPVGASGYEDEIGLEGRPLLRVVLVGDPQRGRRCRTGVPIPGHKARPVDLRLHDRSLPVVKLDREETFRIRKDVSKVTRQVVAIPVLRGRPLVLTEPDRDRLWHRGLFLHPCEVVCGAHRLC
jgi:hypothetical protein